MKLIAEEELTEALRSLPEWRVEGRSLTQTRTFADFVSAMRFVNAAAGVAEELPGTIRIIDIRYNRVRSWIDQRMMPAGLTQLRLFGLAALRLNEHCD